MIVRKFYDREKALAYALEWALSRNPLFSNFTGRGGDCTNFVSQCVLAGSCEMNPEETFGWYFVSENDRSPSWTGVNEFYNFMTGSGDFPPKFMRVGPYGSEVMRENLDVGDVVQLGNEEGSFYHTLFVSGFENGDILVCAHSDDALDRRLSTYTYAISRFIHIDGVNIDIDERDDCFEALINGISLPPVEITYAPEILPPPELIQPRTEETQPQPEEIIPPQETEGMMGEERNGMQETSPDGEEDTGI